MKKLLALLLVCILVFSLTGCDKLDYGKAVDLFNRGKYDAAIDAFHELGDYEDSAQLFTLSHYWAAITRMEEGNYREALPRFIKLGDYEDSAQRATECTYQMALAEFEAGNFTDAQNYFEEVAGYKQSSEYLRRINWQAMYEAVSQVGFDAISGYVIEKEYDGKTYSFNAMHHDHATQELVLEVFQGENGDFSISDGLMITMTADSTFATFEASNGFGMDFVEDRIGSTQRASGRLDITTCTPKTLLSIETFEKHVDDNQGNTIDSTDPADCTMNAIMAENMQDLMTTIPQLLLDAGIELTLQDIGFYALP